MYTRFGVHLCMHAYTLYIYIYIIYIIYKEEARYTIIVSTKCITKYNLDLNHKSKS